MVQDFHIFFPVFVNVVVPVLSGLVYFAMAIYVKRIGPLRTLIAGELTYRGAYLGFLFMGIYLATRPIQILFPHPWPLIVNNIREFCMIGVFGPAVFLAVLSLVFGHDRVPRWGVWGVAGTGLVLAVLFVVANGVVIGGSEPIFRIGGFTAHDGLWFKNPDLSRRAWMPVLFLIRLVDPILMVLLAGVGALWHGITYSIEKRALYDNMPVKLILLGWSCMAFSLSMLSVGLLYAWAHIPNQWWIYYAGALGAGLLETVSLALPMKKHVQVSEHL